MQDLNLTVFSQNTSISVSGQPNFAFQPFGSNTSLTVGGKLSYLVGKSIRTGIKTVTNFLGLTSSNTNSIEEVYLDPNEIALCKNISLEKIPEKYEEFKAEFVHLVRLTQPIMEYYGLSPKVYIKRLYDNVKDLTDTRISLHEPNYFSASLATLNEILSEHESEILKFIPNKIMNNPTELRKYFEKGKYINQGEIYLKGHKPPQDFIKYVINKLKAQSQTWEKMHSHLGYEGIAFQDVYRFVTQGDRNELGAYAFEEEPGYMENALYALKDTFDKKMQFNHVQDYRDLHDTAVQGVISKFGSLSGDRNGPFHESLKTDNKEREYFLKLPTQDLDALYEDKFYQGFRSIGELEFGIPLYDEEGLKDLKKRSIHNNWFQLKERGEGQYYLVLRGYRTFHTDKEEINKGGLEAIENFAKESMKNKGKSLFDHYRKLIKKAKSPIERLMAHIWITRELKIHHLFRDGNGRSTVLLFMGLLNKDPSLPKVLLPDPDIFDAYGPKELSNIIIESMENLANRISSKLKSEHTADEKINKLKKARKAYFLQSDRHEWQYYHVNKKRNNLKEVIEDEKTKENNERQFKEQNLFNVENHQEDFEENNANAINDFLKYDAVLTEDKKIYKKLVNMQSENPEIVFELIEKEMCKMLERTYDGLNFDRIPDNENYEKVSIETKLEQDKDYLQLNTLRSIYLFCDRFMVRVYSISKKIKNDINTAKEIDIKKNKFMLFKLKFYLKEINNFKGKYIDKISSSIKDKKRLDNYLKIWNVPYDKIMNLFYKGNYEDIKRIEKSITIDSKIKQIKTLEDFFIFIKNYKGELFYDSDTKEKRTMIIDRMQTLSENSGFVESMIKAPSIEHLEKLGVSGLSAISKKYLELIIHDQDRKKQKFPKLKLNSRTVYREERYGKEDVFYLGTKWKPINSAINMVGSQNTKWVYQSYQLHEFIDEHSDLVKKLRRNALLECKSKSTEDILIYVNNIINDFNKKNKENMTYREIEKNIDKALDEFMEKIPKDENGEQIITIEEIANEGLLICRHRAMLAASILRSLVEEGILPRGMVRVYRSELLNEKDENQGAHAWAVYRDIEADKLWLCDPRWETATQVKPNFEGITEYGLHVINDMNIRLNTEDKAEFLKDFQQRMSALFPKGDNMIRLERSKKKNLLQFKVEYQNINDHYISAFVKALETVGIPYKLKNKENMQYAIVRLPLGNAFLDKFSRVEEVFTTALKHVGALKEPPALKEKRPKVVVHQQFLNEALLKETQRLKKKVELSDKFKNK